MFPVAWTRRRNVLISGMACFRSHPLQINFCFRYRIINCGKLGPAGESPSPAWAQPWHVKNLVHFHDKPNEPTKKGPLSFVLFESPFTSVSTVSRGHPSLVSLVPIAQQARQAALLGRLSLSMCLYMQPLIHQLMSISYWYDWKNPIFLLSSKKSFHTVVSNVGKTSSRTTQRRKTKR